MTWNRNMNRQKKFFEEYSEGQVFYSPMLNGQFQEFSVKVIEEKSKDTYTKFSTNFFSSSLPWRKEIFGKQDFCTSDSSGRRLYVWRINFVNGVLWILSGGNGRGTSYEWYSEDNKYEKLYEEILEFLLEKYELTDELRDLQASI
jgi:hypothetical protein